MAEVTWAYRGCTLHGVGSVGGVSPTKQGKTYASGDVVRLLSSVGVSPVVGTGGMPLSESVLWRYLLKPKLKHK